MKQVLLPVVTRFSDTTDDCSLEISPEEKAFMHRQVKGLRLKPNPKKSRSAYKYQKWRKSRGVKRCRGCNRRLAKESHHTLCDKCWSEQHNKEINNG